MWTLPRVLEHIKALMSTRTEIQNDATKLP